MSREYDYLFKLVIVGNSSVGKSSLLLRYADDMFNETYLTTIGVDFKFRTINIDGKKVKMQIWDTAGQERFRTITSAYYKGADAIILVYDITNAPSLADVDRFWINEVESYAEKDVELLLLGNKSDMVEARRVETSQAQEYAEKKGMEFYEVSAKAATKVTDAFSRIARKLMEKKDAKNREKKVNRDLNKSASGSYQPKSQNSGIIKQLKTDDDSNSNDREDSFVNKFKKNASACC